MPALTIYAEQDITPAAIDVIRAAKQNVLGEDALNINFIEPGEHAPEGAPILALGKSKTFKDADVTTLSVKQLTSKANAISDLTQALRLVLDMPEPVVYTYRVIESLSELDTLSRTTPIIADIEVGGDIETDLPSETWLLSVAFNDGERILVVPEELCHQAENWVWGEHSPLHTALTDCITVWHNGKFDCRTLNARLGLKIYPSHDTLVMHYVMNHGAKDHALKSLAQKLFNTPDWEAGIKKYIPGGAHYERIPREILYEYNAGDVYWGGVLYRHFRDLLENDPPRRSLYARVLQIVHMLQDLEGNTITVDEDYFRHLSEQLQEEANDHLVALQDMAGDENFNPGSPQQVKKFFAAEGIDLASTAESVLEVAKREMDAESKPFKFIDSLLEYRGITKLKSTYADGILKRTRNGLLHPQFLVHGTTTGRLSSKNPNVQNMPRGPQIRTGLGVILDEGFTDAECDYSQAELRTLAELTGDPGMIAAFQPGAVDYFDAMMPAAFPSLIKTVDDYLEMKHSQGEWHDKAVEMRAKLKGVQYGMNYGRGIAAIATALNISYKEADALVGGIFETYPGLKVWQKNVRRAVTDPSLSHFLTTPFNRQFQQEVVTEKNLNAVQNAALAFVPQSTANDLTLNAALEVHKRSPEYGFKITALIHDAVIGYGPKETAEAWLTMVKREMEGSAAAIFHRVPFNAEATIGENWAVL